MRRRVSWSQWLAAILTLMVAFLGPSMAYAQSCVAGNPIGNFPFTPGVDNTFRPGNSRITNATFNGVAGDVLSFKANPGGANSEIQLVRSANNTTVIATITFNVNTTYTVTAADVAQFPYQMRITNNSTVNQTYVIDCTAAPPPSAPTVTAIAPISGTTAGGTPVTITGTNFTGATAVTIGGLAVTPFTLVNSTTITTTTPAHAAGAVNVVVTTPNGPGTGVGLFTYVAPPAAPTVTGITPDSGPIAGGTAVTITGTNFTGATAVTIGGVAATSVNVVNATTITATTGAHAAGIVDVAVTANGTGTGVGLFTYLAPPAAPTITAIAPVRGTTAGGTPVTITGTDFTGATAVSIGGVPATFTVLSATSISATTGAHAAGIVDVVVTTPNGTGTGAGLFTYVAPVAPNVTAITPSSGPTTGGTSVTIAGTAFIGASSVTIGGVAAPFTVVNATTISATTGAHAAGVVDVAVTTPGGTGTGVGLFTYVAPPTVAAISPNSGTTAGGTDVTITGTDFTGATAVTIGGVAAPFTIVNATTINATTGAHGEGVADVAVTTVGGTGIGAALFTYVAPPGAPNVASISPSDGPIAGGTAVTITGTNFTGATAVSIGGVAAASFTVVNDTSISATTPAHAAGAVDVVVTTPGGVGTGVGLFTYIAPPPVPTVTSISPNSGATAGGTAVTILGTNFTGATAVVIGAVPVTSFTVVDATTITATTGPRAAGLVGVGVTTPGGTGILPNSFTYLAPPTVTAIDPASGTTEGGTVVTITGANFTGATAVTIGGIAATGVTVVSATSITATTPAHAAGAVDVEVTTPGGVGTGAGLFTYVAPPAAPTVTAISPSEGPVAGGTAVTITGTNFTGATAVSIGGVAATGIVVVSDTSITATTGAHAAGVANVVVTTPGGLGTGIGLFTYIAPPAAPSVAAISPASGPTGGGTAVTIAGTNFTGATAVTIGGSAAGSFTIVNDTTITATTGAHAAGVVDVVVTTAGGAGTGSGLYTYVEVQTVPTKTIELIGGFLGRRNTLIASNEPDSNREIDRLMEAEQASGGSSSSSSVASTDLGADRYALALPASLGGASFAANPWDRRSDSDIGPPRIGSDLELPRNWQFSTSLRDITNRYANSEARRAAAAGLGAREGGSRANPFDVWIEGTYASFGDRDAPGDIDGHFGLLALGADYVVNPRLLLGAMAQFDSMSQHSDTEASDIEGQGWMVGPYATMRLGDNVFWRVRAAWGQSSNDVSPFLTYTDRFDSERWLVSSRLTGNLTSGRLTFRPSASVFYMEDVADGYTDGAGLAVPEITSRLGQIEAGPEVSYRYQWDGIQIEPRAGMSIAATFANEANAPGFGQIDGELVGPDGVRTRAELGLSAMTPGGFAIDLSGAYDGIGSDRFEAYSASLKLRLPLN